MEKKESKLNLKIGQWYYGEQSSGTEKTKNRAAIVPCHPTPGHISRNNMICKDPCSPAFIAALSTIAESGNNLSVH